MEAKAESSDPRHVAMLWGSWLAVIMVILLAGLQAMASPNPIWLAVAVAPLALIAIYLRPLYAAFICVFLIYSNIPVVAAQFHGVPYAAVAATPAILLIPVAYFLFVRKEGIVFPLEGMIVVGMVVVQAIGVMVSQYPDEAYADFVRGLFEGLGLFFLVINAIRTPEVLKGCLWALLATGAFMGVVTGHQYATNNYNSNYGGFAQSDQLGFDEVNERGVSVTRARSAGPIGEKNRYAQNMLMLLPIGICLAMTAKNRWLMSLAWIATGLTVVGWAVSFSRGSVVGLGGAIVVAIMLGYLHPRVLVGIGIAGALFVAIMPAYRERVTSLLTASQFLSHSQSGEEADGSLKSRATIMLAAARVMAENPVFGVGPGMFPRYAREYGQKSGFSALEGEWEAHNLYLGIGADNGLLGLGCYLAAVGLLMRRLHGLRGRCLESNPELAAIATALTFALLIYLMTGMFLHFSYIRYFWLIFGIATAAACIIDRLNMPVKTGQINRLGRES